MSDNPNSDIQAAAKPNPFLSMPYEILTEVFRYLSMEDRETLGSVNDRLENINLKAGYGSFNRVLFDSESGNGISVFHSGRWRPVNFDNQVESFNHAKTHQLFLKIRGTKEEDERLKDVFKTLHIHKLNVKFYGGYSGRLANEFVSSCKNIHDLTICWKDQDIEIELAKRTLRDLPEVQNCRIVTDASYHWSGESGTWQFGCSAFTNIQFQHDHPLIDDDTFLHLVRNSTNFTDLRSIKETTITARGIAGAFAMVCDSQVKKVVHCCISRDEIFEWSDQLAASKFEQLEFGLSNLHVTHLDSGAGLTSNGKRRDRMFPILTMPSNAINPSNDGSNQVQNYLLNLPTEILTEIFRYLNLKDRESVGAINDRLYEIELKAGFDRFDVVYFHSQFSAEIMAMENEHWRELREDDHRALYFKHAKTRELMITGSLSVKDEEGLHVALETLDFCRLKAEFTKGYSGRVLSELVRVRKNIEIADFRWVDSSIDLENARTMLKSLPQMGKCRIASWSTQPLIDDETLLHLVRISNRCDLRQVQETGITARGLSGAFEMVCNSPIPKTVLFNIHDVKMRLWCYEQPSSRFRLTHDTRTGMRIRHFDSGATLIFSTSMTMAKVTMSTSNTKLFPN